MKIYSLILLIIIFISCNKKHRNIEKENENLLTATYKNIRIDSNLQRIAKDFLKENSCDSCLNQMYIDKKDPQYKIITLKTRAYSKQYLENNRPTFYCKIDNAIFYVYSGLEDYFISDMNMIKDSTKEDACSNKFMYWTIIDSLKNFRIIKGIGAPFFNLPETPKFKVN